MDRKDRRHVALAALLAMVLTATALSDSRSKRATAADLASIRAYIKKTWHTLTRSNANLAKAAVDPKVRPLPDGRWPVYVSAKEDEAAVSAALQRQMPPEEFRKIALEKLPPNPKMAARHGLLYLPNPYVVPGGRFNEMYGWDSYFIQVGLIRDQEWDLAKDLADNFLYEIRNYGAILNANRTYYLSRSQPPFLTQMVLAVYRHTEDKAWLAAAVPDIEKYYRFWTTAPHLTVATGLSRYYDVGQGPAPESVASEKDDKGRTHYDLVREFFRKHELEDYDISQYYDRAANELKPLFFTGDRSMRESGFDPSNRFGPFSVDVIHYNPVCLNSLLYLMEKETGEILKILDRKGEARLWDRRAAVRAERINRLLWDEQDGLYSDYNFQRRRLHHYPFLTTFYPLWAGIATKQQAERVVQQLPRFEYPGGLQTSSLHSGNQWDAPFGWAPLQMIAVQGMRRYGYTEQADRVTQEFLSLVLKDFLLSGTIVEKYDVVRRSTDVSKAIGYGYRVNVEGFGWTNAAFLEMYSDLPERARAGVLEIDRPLKR